MRKPGVCLSGKLAFRCVRLRQVLAWPLNRRDAMDTARQSRSRTVCGLNQKREIRNPRQIRDPKQQYQNRLALVVLRLSDLAFLNLPRVSDFGSGFLPAREYVTRLNEAPF
jgi:hypothetical protein